MTITTETSKVIYTGDGSTVIFPYTWRILVDADIEVILYTIADGTETTLTLTTDYTVSGAGDAGGGNVTTVATYESTHQVIIKLGVELTQETDLQENDPQPTTSVENVWDKLTLLVKQLQEQLNRAIIQDSAQTTTITFPVASSDKYIGWNTAATALENKTLSITETEYNGTISAGADASKAASPGTNDIYIATDTQIWYACYSAGTWTVVVGGDTFYIGDPITNGAWRLRDDATDLKVERRESGTWVEKGGYTS